MSDVAHDWTEKRLRCILTQLQAEYKQAGEELQEKAAEHFRRFRVKDKIKRGLVAAGQMSNAEYQEWRRRQFVTGKRWTDMRDTIAEDLTNVNKLAAAMIRGEMAGVFAYNANFSEFLIENGMRIDYGFQLYSAETVRNLMIDDPDIIPWLPEVDVPKDLRWNRQLITSSTLQGILQGESIERLSWRLFGVVNRNWTAAQRTARTAITAAQNAGRQRVYNQALAMGLDFLKKEWVATLDKRTRHEHGFADGQKVPLNKPFSIDGYKMMHPGDTSAPGYLVYNCRCTMITREPENITRGSMDRMTFSEWSKRKAG